MTARGKANLDVEIAVDMLSLAGRYDTAVLVSGDEDFVYAINAVAYKGCRVEVAGFRSNTAPRLIDVADFFIDLGDIAELIRKDITQTGDYDVPSFLPPDEVVPIGGLRPNGKEQPPRTMSVERHFNDEDDEGADFIRVRDER